MTLSSNLSTFAVANSTIPISFLYTRNAFSTIETWSFAGALMSTSQYVFSSSINELPFSVGCIILTSTPVIVSVTFSLYLSSILK